MLNVNAYLRSLILDPNGFYTPTSLRVPHALGVLFHLLRRVADHQVREYGRSMYWQGGVGVECLVPSPANFIGEAGGNSVDLQIGLERLRADYIGDFHVHPYAEKYGPGISIAPSNGDWDVWWQNPPAGRNVAVHFVASGDDLFLVVFRRLPVGALIYNNVTSDAGRLNQAVMDWDDRQQGTYADLLQRGQWAELRRFLNTTSPRLTSMHRDDAHSMNIGLANANRCEYFKGTLHNGASTLYLASERVLGNWFTSNFWSTSNQPWLNFWPFA